MADLDAELLALAGGDSSGEESSSPQPTRKKSLSPQRPISSSRLSPEADNMSRKGLAKPVRRPRRRKDDSDDDEASLPSSRSSSASLSRSDSGGDIGRSEAPIFAYENLYHDAADKKRILAKPEIEREEILAQRGEQVERHEQDLTLRRLVAARAKEEEKAMAKNKRKAGTADLEDSQRKSSRQRTKLGGGRAGEADSAIAAYKKQRAEKGIRDEQRRRDAAARAAASPENGYSDVDGDAESDNDYYDSRNRRRDPTPPKDDPVADLVDIQRATIGREHFVRVMYYPEFEQSITGCYARVCLGPGDTPGVNVYRLCLIKGFEKGRPYAMLETNGRPFPVDTYLVAAHGHSSKPWPFLECSMSKVTEAEWRRYRIVVANEGGKLPTKGDINKKLDAIHKLLEHRLTSAEITAKLKKQTDLRNKINKTEEKDAIEEKIGDATRAGDWEAVAVLEDQLAGIVPIKLGSGTSLKASGSATITKEQEKQERLAELNRRNERMNQETVRKAQLAEMKARKPRKHLAVGGIDDLFEGSDISRSGTPVNGRSGTPRPQGTPQGVGTPQAIGSRPGTPVNTTVKTVPLSKNRLATIRRALNDEEIMATMDLGIEIDI